MVISIDVGIYFLKSRGPGIQSWAGYGLAEGASKVASRGKGSTRPSGQPQKVSLQGTGPRSRNQRKVRRQRLGTCLDAQTWGFAAVGLHVLWSGAKFKL